MAAVVLGFSFGVTACSDDDDDNNGKEQRSDIDPLDNDDSQTAFRWLCALANVDALDANWKSKTYEPTVGQASENNEYTRIVVVETLDEAKVNFASFADKKVEELGSKVVVSGGAAGSMTWEPSKAGASNLAVVDVKSNILPHLQKLVYCTQDQVGQNGGLFGNDMKGTPYYRFGDVIQDPDGYYWVCVRPCFAANPADETGYKDTKGDSHWINIFNASETGDKKAMPKDNIKDKWNNLDKYKNQTILLPTGLAYEREHLFNLTQLIWALVDPAKYNTFCSNNPFSALGGFPYRYNGENFLKSVAQYWNEKDANGRTIWQKLFNHTYEEMKELKQIDLFYNGYSWTIGNSGYCWRYTSKEYAKAYSGSASDDKEEFNFVQNGFDITHFAQTPNSKPLPWGSFSKNNTGNYGRWVVRYKRGDKLMTGGKFNYYAKITSSTGNVTDVYRYNEKKGIDAGAAIMPQSDSEINKKVEVYEGNLIGSDGKFYTKVSDMSVGVTPVAIVCRVSDTPLEAGTQYNALAMAYNVSSDTQIAWGGNDDDCSVTVANAGEGAVWPTILNGLAATEALVNGCGKKHDHQAAKFCNNYTCALSEAQRQKAGFSKWFLPSLGQWIEADKGLGMSEWNDNNGFLMKLNWVEDVIGPFLSRVGAGQWFDDFKSGNFWTSTTLDKTHACTFALKYFFSANQPPKNDEKTKKCDVIPFIAFQVTQ